MGVDYGTGEEVVVQAAGDWQGQQNNWLIALIVLTLVTPVSLYFTVPMVSKRVMANPAWLILQLSFLTPSCLHCVFTCCICLCSQYGT
jgi:hypothetical protein